MDPGRIEEGEVGLGLEVYLFAEERHGVELYGAFSQKCESLAFLIIPVYDLQVA